MLKLAYVILKEVLTWLFDLDHTHTKAKLRGIADLFLGEPIEGWMGYKEVD